MNLVSRSERIRLARGEPPASARSARGARPSGFSPIDVPASSPDVKALRVAVLIKQIPVAEELELGPDRRLVRTGAPLEINPYCRRAITKGVELAAEGGRCVVFSLGPPAAEDAVREAVAAGASEGVLICDEVFAGSDTLATARTLVAALRLEEPFDLVLTGLNSVDADTGQVGPEVAELLGWPFASGVRSLEMDESSPATFRLGCERDDGFAHLQVGLPTVLSVAERLCAPAEIRRRPRERTSQPSGSGT